MVPTPTFWLESTGLVRLGLRRYSISQHTGWTCQTGWHQALAWLPDTVPARRDDRGYLRPPPTQPRDHPSWPAECGRGCGYRFTPEDRWQSWQDQLYRPADNRAGLRVLHPLAAPPDAPSAEPGASWDATWTGWAGPDGICLVVRLPSPGSTRGSHDWHVDAPASNGGGWTRHGDPRRADVTAHPSIAAGHPHQPGYYHGFLHAGVLTDHIG